MLLKKIIGRNKLLYCLIKIIKHRKDEHYLDRALSFEYDPLLFCFGDRVLKINAKNCYYLIEISGDKLAGYFALYRQVITAVYLADKLGLIPCINVRDTLYNDTHNNLFDYFYEPVCKKSQYEILKEDNYFRFEGRHLELVENAFVNEKYEHACGYHITEEYITELSTVVKKYFRLKSDFKAQVDEEIKNILKGRILGIQIRGTDYASGLTDHPKITSKEQYYTIIDKLIKEKYDKLFIATDEKAILDGFIKRYGNRVVYYKDTFRSYSGEPIHKQIINRDDNGYQMAREVMRDMLTLSKCDGLLAGISQVSICARIQKRADNGEYDYLNIIDNGLY